MLRPSQLDFFGGSVLVDQATDPYNSIVDRKSTVRLSDCSMHIVAYG